MTRSHEPTLLAMCHDAASDSGSRRTNDTRLGRKTLKIFFAEFSHASIRDLQLSGNVIATSEDSPAYFESVAPCVIPVSFNEPLDSPFDLLLSLFSYPRNVRWLEGDDTTMYGGTRTHTHTGLRNR